ncbi:acyltransferase family protein [Burkholderia sp. MSMB1835]|uniref:acyltransferase family protein n=1 Tax=Burkholderia sp. MSMB1835 TaxID=1637876 RepID=UPI00075E55DA|nr:acyltransferase [Burkholderia sp. MSMB1835]KVL37824.1 acyltransferase [Burkholderia sp. MSMB1835]
MNTLGQRNPFFRNIQCARAFAALAVVGYHMGILPAGQAGVDLFFVISGFIMSCVAPCEGRAFFRKRLIRIVPLYWLTTLGVFAIATWRPQWLNTTTASAAYLVKSLLFIPYVKDNGHWGPLNLNGWTLEYEMLFYVVVAGALVLVCARYATALAAALLALFCAYVAAMGTSSAVADHLGQPFVLEFGLGVLAYWLLETGIGHRVGPRVWTALAVVGLATMALLPVWHGTPAGFARAAWWGGAACVLVVALIALDLHGWTIKSRALAALGAASYSIYLIHPYVIGFAAKLMGLRAAFDTPGGIGASAAILLAVGVSGYGCHVWIEKPMLATLNRTRRLPGRLPKSS